MLGATNALFCDNSGTSKGNLVILITGFKTSRGQSIVCVYDSKDNFLKENLAVRKTILTISNQSALIHSR